MKTLLKGLFFLCFFPLFAFSQHYETKLLRKNDGEKITQYETIEIGIRVPAQERMFRAFLENHATGINPFTQKFLRLQFICHGKTYNVPAFYMQEASADDALNKYVTRESQWPWRVRFAVPDTGNWQCLILIGETLEKSVPQSSGISFSCIPGKNHGYIHIANDQKHFQFSDGKMFFALGQNIAWADEPILRGYAGTPPMFICGYYDVYHYINELADNGGNYVRFFMAPWSTGLEGEEIGVYSQDRAFALDSMFRLAESRGLKIQLSLDLSMGFNRNLQKDKWNPYRKTFQKEGMTAADILRDSVALNHFDNYIRYVYARWAFSPSVLSIELVSEQELWDGYAEHENNFKDFFKHVDHLIRDELNDHVHLISTSFSSVNFSSIYENSALSFIDVHHYDNNFKCNQKRFHYVTKNSTKKLHKPFIFGEIGMINGPVNAADADDIENCMDVSFHNTYWATTFMGTAGTGLYWWQWKNDAYRKNNFPALRFFLDSIAGNLIFEGTPGMFVGNGLESFYQSSKSGYSAIGWVHNTSYWWGNMMQECRDRNEKQMFLPKDNDKVEKPESRAGKKFNVDGLKSQHYYLVTFYDTRNANKKLSSVVVRANMFGVIHVPIPDVADCAFKVSRTFPVRFNF